MHGRASLESFEDQAFQALQKKKSAKANSRQASAKPKDVCKVMKRPSASSKKVQDKAKIYGCKRCRGNVKGCTQCSNPEYTAQRFQSREEWKEYARVHNLK